MSREIKFRVWTGLTMEYNVVVGKDGAFYALIDRNDSASLSPTSKYHSDTPRMEYTGLKDCNGVEIYEGDILTCDLVGDDLQTVIFENGIFTVDYLTQGCYTLYDEITQMVGHRVIGNIFENSELIK